MIEYVVRPYILEMNHVMHLFVKIIQTFACFPVVIYILLSTIDKHEKGYTNKIECNINKMDLRPLEDEQP